jgi:hypothetical protein
MVTIIANCASIGFLPLVPVVTCWSAGMNVSRVTVTSTALIVTIICSPVAGAAVNLFIVTVPRILMVVMLIAIHAMSAAFSIVVDVGVNAPLMIMRVLGFAPIVIKHMKSPKNTVVTGIWEIRSWAAHSSKPAAADGSVSN